MYSMVYKLYFVLKRMQKRVKSKEKKRTKIVPFLIGYVEWFYNIPIARWYAKHPSKRKGVTERKREQKIIVSLTTYPKRIGTIWLTIETLMRQSVKADEIVLWLALSQFEEGVNSLPESLLRLQSRGLTIRFCDDLRSHKKYYYALQEYPNDLVVLADDDMFYPRDTIKKLLKLHQKWPNDICCITAQVIGPKFSTMPSQWRNPRLDEDGLQHVDHIQAFTGSGTLLPPNVLPAETFDAEQIRKLCLHADDLWIAFMAKRKGTKVTTLEKWRPFPICIYGTAEGSLYYINGEGNQNDIQWQNLLEYYGVENNITLIRKGDSQ